MNDNEIYTSNWGQTEVDTAATQAIKDIAKEFNDAALTEALAEDPTSAGTGDVPTGDPAVNQAAGTESNTVTTDVPPAGPKEDPLARADVRYEVEMFQLRQRLEALEAENKALKAPENARKAQNLPQDLVMALRTDPIGTWTAQGLDPDEVIRVALAQKLGDKAPAELRQATEQAKTQAQIKALEAKLLHQSQQMAQRAYFDQVNSGAADFVRNLGESKDAPTVSRVAKSDGARVHAEIMEEILRDAQSRAAKEPNGQLLSYPDALKRVEARWSGYEKLLRGAQAPATPASTVQPKQVTDTKPPTTIKPPERPLPPWLRRIPTEEDAIKAGVAEFARQEIKK